MKMVKLSDFYPYDRNKGGIQELHHKIESKTLQYWGEDSGILIGITPIYKRRLWSEEVKVVNDKMTNMKTRTYEGVQHGEQPGRRVVRGLLQWPHGHRQQAHRRHGSDGN